MQRITSRQNPLVTRCRAVARGDAPDLLLLDGVHLVSEALSTHLGVRQVIVSADAIDRDTIRDLINLVEGRGIEITCVATPVMDAISPVRSRSDIVAIADVPARDHERLYGCVAPLIVVAADVQDPGNIGAIVRVAEAAGASGAIIAGHSANPFGWKALRGSMGSALRLPIAVHALTEDGIQEARQHGCRIVATVPTGGRSLFEVDWRGPVAILIGGEGGGLPTSVVATADLGVTIPMEAPVESLNAAVSAALVLYEARRQRTNHKEHKGHKAESL